MWGVGLLIFYVTNETNETNEKSPFSGPPKIFDFGVSFGRFRGSCILVHFVPHFGTFCTGLSRAKAVPLHRISKRAEIPNKHVNC